MSHIVEIQTEIRDPAAITAACQRMKVAQPTHGMATLYGTQVTGWQVQLPKWKYPVVCDTTTGQVKYDNYRGYWGDQAHLNQFLQSYAVEKARIEARRQGHTVTEQLLTDGSIKVTVQIGGAA